MKNVLVLMPVEARHKAVLAGESLRNEVDFTTGYKK